MNARTFAALLAALVMLLAAGTRMWIQTTQPDREDEENAPEAASDAGAEEGLMPPVEGGVRQAFGPYYIREYRQWTMCEETVYDAEAGENVYAPVDGTVVRIEAVDGGSRVVLMCEGTHLVFYPVRDVRVFTGSSAARGDVLARTVGELRVYAEADGQAVDWRTIAQETTFDAAAGVADGAVE